MALTNFIIVYKIYFCFESSIKRAVVWKLSLVVLTLLPALLLWRFIRPLASLVSDSLASMNSLANFTPNFTLSLHPVQSNSPSESLPLPLRFVGSHAQFSRAPSLQALAMECTTPAEVIEWTKATSLLPVMNTKKREVGVWSPSCWWITKFYYTLDTLILASKKFHSFVFVG